MTVQSEKLTPMGRLRRRISRLTLRRVSPVALIVLVACWATTLVLTILILSPLLDQLLVNASSAADGLNRFLSPWWLRTLMSASLGVLAAVAASSSVVARGLGGEGSTPRGILREVALASAVGVPVLGLLADQNWLAAALAAVFATAAELWVHRSPARSTVSVVVAAVLAAAVWVVVLATQSQTNDSSWLWSVLFLIAACSAAFAAFYAIPRVAESRGRVVAPLFRNDHRSWVVLLFALAAVAVVAVRATVARDLFTPLDSQIWSPWNKQAMSWVIALVVAAMLVWYTLRSSSRPYARLGSRGVIAALAAIGSIQLVLALAVTVVAMIIATFTGVVRVWDAWVDWYQAASFLLVVALGGILLGRRFGNSAGRAIGLTSVVYLLVPLFLVPLADELPPWVSAATPVQIMIIVVLAALALAVVNIVARRTVVAPAAIVRMAIVPVIAVHAGLLLPAALSDFGRIAVVVLVIGALLFLTPPVSADPTRHALNLLTSSGTQLLVVATLVLALPSLWKDETQAASGLLWLAVPTMAALMITSRSEPQA